MEFHSPLVKGKFLKRYKRFFADIELDDGQVVVAHVPNTGSMMGLKEPNSSCYISPAQNPDRKLKYTLEMIQTPTSWVGVNTSLPNHLVYELWRENSVAHWKKWDRCQLEFKINKESRLDAVMWNSKEKPKKKPKDKLTLNELTPPLHFIEIKNVTLAEKGTALFPDAVTERGQKHLQELMALIKKGFSCELVFVVQREDCKKFSPADEIDAKYGQLLRQATEAGLIVSAFPCELSHQSVKLKNKSIQVVL